MTTETPKVVIIGGSFAGLKAAKKLFQEASKNNTAVDVTLISQSSKAYYTVGSPRVIVQPELLDKVFLPVESYLKDASQGNKFKFVHASVDSVDLESKTIATQLVKDSSSLVVDYDYLIVASGASGTHAGFRLNGDYENTKKAVTSLSKELKGAKKIAVIGGGTTGVETSGEIGYAYGKKAEITLYTGSKHPVPSLSDKLGNRATSKLSELGVKVVNNLKYKSIEKLADGKTKVEFEDGSSETFDSVILSTSPIPNTGFLPADVKDAKGFLVTDEYLRVKSHPGVYGFGDVLSKGNQTIVDIKYKQEPVLTQVIKKEILKVNAQLKPFDGHFNALIVPISQNGGVGQMFGWGLPDFMIRSFKAKDFGIPDIGKLFN